METINLNGKEINTYSLEHLSFQNPYATEEQKTSLISEIEKVINEQSDTDWGKSFLPVFKIALELVNTNMNEIDDYLGKMKFIIHEGNMFGLGASWGVSKEAYILWAAAAHSLRDNEIDIVFKKETGLTFA